jgi:hypothetical protein
VPGGEGIRDETRREETMAGQNCWEFKQCGREKPNKRGICPATTEVEAHGLNGGRNAGRMCWAVAGTFCEGSVQGTYAEKVLTCILCDFRIAVKAEEGYRFKYIYFRKACA